MNPFKGLDVSNTYLIATLHVVSCLRLNVHLHPSGN